jgi:TusA-related sulfurtransferase
VKVSQQVKKMQVGQVLLAETTDPGALADFPAWAKTSGNEIVNTVREGNVTKFFIKKLK